MKNLVYIQDDEKEYNFLDEVVIDKCNSAFLRIAINNKK